MKETQWIQIAVYPNENFAQIAVQLLKENNIPALLKKDSLSTIYGISGTVVGGRFAVYTTEYHIDEAIELLKTLGEENLTK